VARDWVVRDPQGATGPQLAIAARRKSLALGIQAVISVLAIGWIPKLAGLCNSGLALAAANC
jgi:hypothetical protein